MTLQSPVVNAILLLFIQPFLHETALPENAVDQTVLELLNRGYAIEEEEEVLIYDDGTRIVRYLLIQTVFSIINALPLS